MRWATSRSLSNEKNGVCPYFCSMNAPLKKLNELTGVVFDGRRSGYVPPKRLSISKKLRLHGKAKKDIDPVTFEVVPHTLWNVNAPHDATIQRLSGSPVPM